MFLRTRFPGGFDEMVYRKIQQFEEATLSKKDGTDRNQWTKFRKRFEVLDEEEGWIRYAKHALELYCGKESLKLAKFSSILKFLKCTEVTLKLCSKSHVLFGFECFSKLKEHFILTILFTILSERVNQNTTQLYDVLNKSH